MVAEVGVVGALELQNELTVRRLMVVQENLKVGMIAVLSLMIRSLLAGTLEVVALEAVVGSFGDYSYFCWEMEGRIGNVAHRVVVMVVGNGILGPLMMLRLMKEREIDELLNGHPSRTLSIASTASSPFLLTFSMKFPVLPSLEAAGIVFVVAVGRSLVVSVFAVVMK